VRGPICARSGSATGGTTKETAGPAVELRNVDGESAVVVVVVVVVVDVTTI
jgi:hypothetical protein